MVVRASWTKSTWIVPQYLKRENVALQELKTEKIREVYRAFLAGHTYALKDGWITDLFFHHVHSRNFPVTLLYGARFLKLALDNC